MYHHRRVPAWTRHVPCIQRAPQSFSVRSKWPTSTQHVSLSTGDMCCVVSVCCGHVGCVSVHCGHRLCSQYAAAYSHTVSVHREPSVELVCTVGGVHSMPSQEKSNGPAPRLCSPYTLVHQPPKGNFSKQLAESILPWSVYSQVKKVAVLLLLVYIKTLSVNNY